MASNSLFAAILCVFSVWVVHKVYRMILRPRLILRHVKGPSHDKFFSGHMDIIDLLPAGVRHAQWHERYGPVFKYDGYFKVDIIPRISLTDPVALKYVLQQHAHSFPKPPHLQRMLGQVVGDGIILAEGGEHTRQRRILNPAFGWHQMNQVFPTLLRESQLLRDEILSAVQEGGCILDVYHYATRISLEFIGSAGFGYRMHSLEDGHRNELARAFHVLTNDVTNFDLMHVLVNIWPILRKIDFTRRAKSIAEAEGVMLRIGSQLVKERKLAAIDDGFTGDAARYRDLLSVLVKANMSKDLQPSQRLSDQTVSAQIQTFLFAGDGSVASSITWALFLLAKHQVSQERLRQEIQMSNLDLLAPAWEPLNKLPYLDGIIRETFRLYPAFSGTLRIASQDSVIPLEKPFEDVNGILHHEISDPALQKGVWGDNASCFTPERWVYEGNVPKGSHTIPSVDYMPFSVGPRFCIGFRLAIMELKIVLFTLLQAFQFDLACPSEDVIPIATFLTRPKLRSKMDHNYQLPLKLTPLISTRGRNISHSAVIRPRVESIDILSTRRKPTDNDPRTSYYEVARKAAYVCAVFGGLATLASYVLYFQPGPLKADHFNRVCFNRESSTHYSYRLPYTGTPFLDGLSCVLVAFAMPAMIGDYRAHSWTFIFSANVASLATILDSALLFPSSPALSIFVPLIAGLANQAGSMGVFIPVYWLFSLLLQLWTKPRSAKLDPTQLQAITVAFMATTILPTLWVMLYSSPLTIMFWNLLPVYNAAVHVAFHYLSLPQSHSIPTSDRSLRMLRRVALVTSCLANIPLLKSIATAPNPFRQAIDLLVPHPTTYRTGPDDVVFSQEVQRFLQFDIMFATAATLLGLCWDGILLSLDHSISGWIRRASLILCLACFGGPGALMAVILFRKLGV